MWQVNHVLIKGISLMGCRAGEAIRQGHADGAARMKVLRQWAADGKIRPFVSHAVPLERVQDAYRMMWNRKVVGRICVCPDGEDEARRTAGPSPVAAARL